MHIQRNELGKNRSRLNGVGDMVSTVNRVKQKGACGETVWKNDRSKATEESFQDSLQRSMNAEMPVETNTGINYEERTDFSARPDNGALPYTEPGFGMSKAESIGIHVERDKTAESVKEVAVRRISYSECDKVDVNILEGYTLKAKLEMDEEGNPAGGCHVYVEMKDEEGTMKACLFDGAGLKENSHNAMERIAYAAIMDSAEK